MNYHYGRSPSFWQQWKHAIWVIGGIFGVLVIVLIIRGVTSSGTSSIGASANGSSQGAIDGVSVKSCTFDVNFLGYSDFYAYINITNTTSTVNNYSYTVSWYQNGFPVGDTTNGVYGDQGGEYAIAPGQHVVSYSNEEDAGPPISGPVTCRLSDVQFQPTADSSNQ